MHDKTACSFPLEGHVRQNGPSVCIQIQDVEQYWQEWTQMAESQLNHITGLKRLSRGRGGPLELQPKRPGAVQNKDGVAESRAISRLCRYVSWQQRLHMYHKKGRHNSQQEKELQRLQHKGRKLPSLFALKPELEKARRDMRAQRGQKMD